MMLKMLNYSNIANMSKRSLCVQSTVCLLIRYTELMKSVNISFLTLHLDQKSSQLWLRHVFRGGTRFSTAPILYGIGSLGGRALHEARL